MHRNRGLSLIELLLLIVCAGVVAVILFAVRAEERREAHKAMCKTHLRQLAQAMQLYMLQFGDTSMYAVPAPSFRGDAWLATLYGIKPACWGPFLRCPATRDTLHVPEERPADLAAASAIPADAISYAGRCHGLTGSLASRNTHDFSESAISPAASAMACDDNEGPQNHRDGVNVVYFDTHVEFKPGSGLYREIGKPGASVAELRHMDSGE